VGSYKTKRPGFMMRSEDPEREKTA
jgi:hypothetical protein